MMPPQPMIPSRTVCGFSAAKTGIPVKAIAAPEIAAVSVDRCRNLRRVVCCCMIRFLLLDAFRNGTSLILQPAMHWSKPGARISTIRLFCTTGDFGMFKAGLTPHPLWQEN